jgi:isohexenylglutaconyl-CoA hydratase
MTDPATFDTLLYEIDHARGYAHLTLNRPETRNAMNFRMVEELYHAVEGLRGRRDVRVLVLRGANGTFCAGGDIKEMRENHVPGNGSRVNLDKMLRAFNTADQIVVSVIEGAALGGGFGLACVSDIALATTTAEFGLPEVRLGLTPAFISPYVIERLGLTRARELMLSGRRFKGALAAEYGLVHRAVEPDQLDGALADLLHELRHCAPNAIAATKALIFTVKDAPLDDTVEYRANLLNTLRAGDEAQEGLLAFMQKRAPRWSTGGEA